MSTGRFIVSTGRCGSTLLGKLLGTHPDVLNVSELFASLQPDAFPSGPATGRTFWNLLSTPLPDWSDALTRGLQPREFLYPVEQPLARFNRITGVPPIAAICLPSITEDPDAMYGELERAVPRFGEADIATQYGRLFDWLTARLGRRLWVERSGGSLLYAKQLVRLFPEARFLHLYRDGRETALSMRSHLYFRAQVADLDAEPSPLERFGVRWSATIVAGTTALAALPGQNVKHLAYEQLVADPDGELRSILAFFSIPSPPDGWIAQTARRIERRRVRWPSLPLEERRKLATACAVGERRLREIVGASAPEGA
jgi:putative sulfotransferase